MAGQVFFIRVVFTWCFLYVARCFLGVFLHRIRYSIRHFVACQVFYVAGQVFFGLPNVISYTMSYTMSYMILYIILYAI